METILILDDEQVVRQSFVDYFEDQMWNPIQAGSGEEALGLIKDASPAAAIVDIHLPGIDGNEFIREVSSRSEGVACVICTGSPSYVMPQDVIKNPQVSNKLFKKPVMDLVGLEVEVRKLIKEMGVQSESE